MNELATESPRWSARLNELCPQVATTASARSEAWQIVYFNLARYLRYQAARFGRVSSDDISDIASQKTLELMGKVDISSGPLMELAPERIPGFLSTVARNGLITFLKKAKREVAGVDDEASDDSAHPTAPSTNPAVTLESKEYAKALGRCVKVLEQRARALWFFRVCYDMSSKDIAAHPLVSMSASHVDVTLHRTRQALRDCMHSRGLDTHVMPPGTFMALWQIMHPFGENTKEAM